MTDERPGDSDDNEEAAGPPDESIPGDPDRHDPTDERRTDDEAGGDSEASGDGGDGDGDGDGDEPGPPPDETYDSDRWDDEDESESESDGHDGRDANPSPTPDALPGVDDDEAPGDPSEYRDDDADDDATADGGSEATEFGGDINPHVDPSTGGPAEGAPAAPEDAGGLGGAPDDEEMPLAQHIEEMVRRLGIVIVVMALVSGLTFPFADRLITFLWYSFLSGSPEVCPTTDTTAAACPHLFHPLALMFARLKVASLVGFIAALPLTVYQSYLFMRPGLYPRERRYYLASVPTSLVLAGVGVLFAYLLILPTLFVYFTGYTEQAAEVTFSLTETFNLIVMMLGFFALVFQIPLLIMLAVMMGVTSRRWLAGRRIYFWGGFATVAFLFSPDPTGMAPILVAATMILLFEGTLLLLYWTGEATTLPEAEAVAARRPFAWLVSVVAGYAVSTAPLPQGYYDRLPAALTETLAQVGMTRMTPLLIGVALIGTYEGVLYLYRRFGDSARTYGRLARARVAVWPLSLFVGYLGSPDPELLQRVGAVDLAPVEAAGVVVGLVVTFEFVVVVLDWYQNRG
ncbi:twin-arginine translocase subunit TatC [Halosimplex salinum]|uniref:twin-arginine translocase subunit TatC n=1 Tax=Halosimplex salinum TaxID=1710538 RepID=UPI000F47B02D|nr:twin-arginine translocase subunit TatC [Halosimplex salinum]